VSAADSLVAGERRRCVGRFWDCEEAARTVEDQQSRGVESFGARGPACAVRRRYRSALRGIVHRLRARDCFVADPVAWPVGAGVARRRSRWRRARRESDTASRAAGGGARVFLARGSGGAGGRPARLPPDERAKGGSSTDRARWSRAGRGSRSRAPSGRRCGAPRGGRAQRISMSPSRDRSHSRLESAMSRMTLAFCFSAYAPATRSAGMNTSR
jgi:hypothetical protein